MICTSLTLLDIQIVKDSIGVQKEEEIRHEIPIIKVEDVYSNEFYEAEQRGHRPELRFRISALNYNDETELIYNSKKYSIIRTQNITIDELVLVCERKIKNINERTGGSV